MSNVIHGVFNTTGTQDDADGADEALLARQIKLAHDTSKEQIAAVIKSGSKGVSKSDLALMVSNLILKIERRCGSQFVSTIPDGQPMFLEGLQHRLYRLDDKSRPFMSYFADRYGINKRDALTQYIVANVQDHCMQRGIRHQMRRFVAFDKAAHVLYVSTYTGKVWRLNGKSIRTETNGENVFFIDDDGGRPIDFEIPLVPPSGLLLDVITDHNFTPMTPGGMTPTDQKRALIIWTFCTAFPDLMPTKPILLLEGGFGAGKSTTVENVQLIIHGRVKPMAISVKREDDFPVQLLRSPIAMFDNVDTFVEWLPNALAAYCTGGEFVRRKLYEDDVEVSIQPHSFIAATSRNPSTFRREDVIDRSVILRLDRRPNFGSKAEMRARIELMLPQLLGEWLGYLNLIVERLKTKERNFIATQRMADFEGMAYVIGDVLGWSHDDVASTLDAIQRERHAFSGETDGVPELLEHWIANAMNEGRTVTAEELLHALNVIAGSMGKTGLRSVTSLVQRLRSPHLEATFDIRATTANGHRVYAVRKRAN